MKTCGDCKHYYDERCLAPLPNTCSGANIDHEVDQYQGINDCEVFAPQTQSADVKEQCDLAAAWIRRAGMAHRLKLMLSAAEATEMLKGISDLYRVGTQWYYKGIMVNYRTPAKKRLDGRCRCGILLQEIDPSAGYQVHKCKCGRWYKVKHDRKWKRWVRGSGAVKKRGKK